MDGVIACIDNLRFIPTLGITCIGISMKLPSC